MANKTGLYVIAASSFKKMADYAVSLFQPLFFAANFPNNSSEFIFANAFYYLVPTTIGAVVGGYLSDKYEKKNYWSKAIICGTFNFIAAPFCAKALLDGENTFWMTVFYVSMQWFFDSMWISPSIVMLQNTTSTKNQGSAVSIFYLATTMAGIVSTGFLGYVQGHINGAAHPELYG